jgi:hypothetical protein
MKKPMKTKRYADGDLVEEDFKKKGLESSKGDRVGLLERLRMGNIDSPNSEAYRRYGAGRGRTDADIASRMKDRAVNAAAPNQEISRMGSATPSNVQSPFTMGRVPMGGPSEAEAPRKLPITVEGDYSGKPSEAGKPSMSSRPSATKVVKKSAAKDKKKPAGYQIDDEGPAKIGSQNTFNMDKAFKGKKEGSLAPLALGSMGALLGGAALSGAKSLGKRARQGGSKPIDERPSSAGRNPRLMSIDPMMESDLERMAGEGGPNFKKGGKAKVKSSNRFASGGSVSSASKRGDGIAQKGKTKGRIC